LSKNFKVLESRINKRIEQSSEEDLRTDDNLKILNKRINIYKESTLPIVDYYKSKNILHEIDAMESIEAVYNNILKIIE
jgi:adenylate kinase